MSSATFFLYLICVFMRPQDWVPGMMGLPFVNILGIATIFFLLLESAGKAQDRQLVKVPQTWLMFAFFFAILMSHVSHHYFFGLTDTFTKFYPTFILFYVMLNALNTESRLKTAIWLILLMMGLMVLQGVYQVQHGVGWAGQDITVQSDIKAGTLYRINWVGIFSDPNDLALTFVIGIGLLLPFIFSNVNILLRLFSAAMAAYLGYGIFLANSRGGQIALAVGIVYFFIRKTKKFVLGGILGTVGAAAFLVLGPSRMSMMSSSEESAATRLDLWYGGLQIFKANPIFGRGWGMFMEDLPQTAHNSYVLAVAELGFVGLFLWMALIYISMKGLLLVQNSANKSLARYALGIQSALMGFCAAAFFLSRTYVILPYMLFAMAGSVVWLAQATDKNLQLKFDGKDFFKVFLLTVGVILAVVIMIRGR